MERLPAFDEEDGGNVIRSRSRVTIEAFADTGNCCFINVDVVVFICFSINGLLDVGDSFFHILLLFRVEAGVIRKGANICIMRYHNGAPKEM